MRRFTRRQLLGTAFVGTLGFSGWYVYRHNFEHLVVSILRAKLGFLKLDQRDLERFAQAFDDDDDTSGLKGRLAALGRPLLAYADDLDLVGSEIDDEFEYRVVSRFLLSTDFFRNGADESLPVRYLAYFTPTGFACANPFANLGDT